jgi:transitional endoplasmic reticulum ATPase
MRFPRRRRHPFPRRSQSATSAQLDRDDRLVYRRAASYLDGILERHGSSDPQTLAFLFWVLGDDASQLWDELGARLSGEERASFEQEVVERDGVDDVAAAIARTWRKKPKSATEHLLSCCRKALRRRSRRLSYRGLAQLDRVARRVQRILDLSPLETDLCLFVRLVSEWSPLETYLCHHLDCLEPPGRKYLAAALGVSMQELWAAQDRLTQLGVIDRDHHWVQLAPDYMPLFRDVPEDRLARELYRAAPKRGTLPLDCHQVDARTTEHLLALLERSDPESGSHVLLYGPPGTGKTSYSRGLAKKLGVPAYEVLRGDDTRRAAQRAAILACVKMTNHGASSLVIVDEADMLLQPSSSPFGLLTDGSYDKGWLNLLLERPGLRMIWICNRVDGIDAAVQRRFAYSVRFASFSRRQRRALWDTIATRHRVRRLLRAEDRDALAGQYQVEAGAIEIAVRSAKQIVSGASSPSGEQRPSRDAFLHALRGALDAQQTLRRGGKRAAKTLSATTGFCLDALNTDVGVETIVQRVERVDQRLRERGARPASGMRMLFFGPPGTGKSALARYLAKKLDRRAFERRPSDLLSKWVGETEQNIAAAFATAEQDDAVLILDEVDALLFGRDNAQRSWEISFTNELLSQLERYRGLLICTTNRLDGLDQAALRRFQLKAGFDYLTPEGAARLYGRLLARLCPAGVTVDVLRKLQAIEMLTPGDFSVVRDNCELELRPSHDELLEQLRREAAIRSKRQGRRIGF